MVSIRYFEKFVFFSNIKKMLTLTLFAFAMLTSSSLISSSIGSAKGAVKSSVELIVLEQQGCYMCKRFRREIASAYPKTRQGNIAKLRFVDIFDPWPKDLKRVRSDVFTPTFVLVKNGREVTRLRGYPGPDFFWSQIDEMIEQLPR